MVISETDRAMLFQVAVTCTAQKAAISEAHLKSVPELLEEVEWVDSRGFRILKEFLEAWEAWFQFHVRIERDGKQGALSSDQETELRATTQERDSKRRSLMSYLH